MSDNNEKPKPRKVTPASDITNAFDPVRGSEDDKSVQGVVKELKKESGDVDAFHFSTITSKAAGVLSVRLVDEVARAIVRNIFNIGPPTSLNELVESEGAIKARCKAFLYRNESIKIQSKSFWQSVDIALDYAFSEDELEQVISITDNYDLWPVLQFLDLLEHTDYTEKLFKIIVDAMEETDTFNV